MPIKSKKTHTSRCTIEDVINDKQVNEWSGRVAGRLSASGYSLRAFVSVPPVQALGHDVVQCHIHVCSQDDPQPPLRQIQQRYAHSGALRNDRPPRRTSAFQAYGNGCPLFGRSVVRIAPMAHSPESKFSLMVSAAEVCWLQRCGR